MLQCLNSDSSGCSLISNEKMHKAEETHLSKPPQFFPVIDRQTNQLQTTGLFQ